MHVTQTPNGILAGLKWKATALDHPVPSLYHFQRQSPLFLLVPRPPGGSRHVSQLWAWCCCPLMNHL